jgi:hypothetical protein
MKTLLGAAALLTVAGLLFGQAPAPAPGRGPAQAPASPAVTESKTIAGKTISITYSSPGVKGREGKIFTKDGLIASTHKSYPVWRAGANSATKFHTDADLQIYSLLVPKGDYTLYVDITNPDVWVLVINKQTGQWGLTYDQSQDLGRIIMRTDKPPAMVENLKYTLTETGPNSVKLELAWENHVATVPITVK